MTDVLSGTGEGQGAADQSNGSAGSPAPAVAPGASQATAESNPDAPGARPGEVAPVEPKRRPTLPGVMPRDPDDIWIGRRRDEKTGRYVSARGEDDSAEVAEAEAEDPSFKQPEAEKAPKLPEGTEPPKQGFRFAGQTFADQAAAEQNHRSMQGMFRGMKDEITQLKERHSNTDKAYQAWKADSERKDAIIAELRAGRDPQAGQSHNQPSAVQNGSSNNQSQPGIPASEDELLSGVDFDLFESLSVQGGLPAGGRYLAKQILSKVLNTVVPALRAEHQQFTEPYKAAEEQAAVYEHAGSIVEQVASLESQPGVAAFPELRDENTVRLIARTWRESGNDPSFVLTPNGLMAAVALYRMARGFTPQAPVPVTAVNAPAPVPASAPVASPSPNGGGGAGRPAPRGPQRTPEHQRLVDALESAQFPDRNLGFVRHRSERTF